MKLFLTKIIEIIDISIITPTPFNYNYGVVISILSLYRLVISLKYSSLTIELITRS